MDTYMAIDQHGQTFHDLGPHPRKALMDRLDTSHAAKMYVDTKAGESRHIGYVIARLWLTLFKVERINS